MKRTEEGNYDTWGVRFADGKIREFGSLKKASLYQKAMEGKDVVQADGRMVTLTGLTVVHRHIPNWTQVVEPTQILNEQEALDQDT